MTHRISHLVTVFILAGFAVFLGILQPLLAAQVAHAYSGAGHGPGYLSEDGWWLGAYRLDDGAQGFCLNAGKPSPTGHVLDYIESTTLGWYTPEQSASLAYIARTWASTDDSMTAAAGQIATWIVAGLDNNTPEQVAARAGADAGRVLARAWEMVNEAAQLGSTSIQADTVLELADTGPGRVRVELSVARPSGNELLPPGAHFARVALDGAAFADGSTESEIPTGTDVEVTPTETDPNVTVSAHAKLGPLPYGDRLLIALPRDDAQAVLVAVPSTAQAQAQAEVAGPSPLPFQPLVSTVTSDPEAVPGARVHDRLTITVDTSEGLLPSWGVRAADDGFEPVEVTVESTLHGPFLDPITESASAPEGASIACTVHTTVNGIGDYVTPECTIPAPGYYVWTERIDPTDVPVASGGERIRPWQSTFGIASEITLASAPASEPPETAIAVLAETGSSETGMVALASMLLVGGTSLITVARIVRHRLRRPAHRRA